MGWHAVDSRGHDAATGRPPRASGAPTPAAALLAVPVATWPLRLVAPDSRTLDVAAALGPGGTRVASILARLAAAASPPQGLPVHELARATPGGTLELPVALASPDEALRAVARVDPAWMARVDELRSVPRTVLVAAGRETELEAALNLAMLLGTERVDEAVGEGPARVASGARLWLLGPAVAWALASRGEGNDPFAAWAELVSFGAWPLGPVGGQLVVCLPCRGSAPDDGTLTAIAG